MIADVRTNIYKSYLKNKIIRDEWTNFKLENLVALLTNSLVQTM
jgi:hypothetical protein